MLRSRGGKGRDPALARHRDPRGPRHHIFNLLPALHVSRDEANLHSAMLAGLAGGQVFDPAGPLVDQEVAALAEGGGLDQADVAGDVTTRARCSRSSPCFCSK